MNTLLHKPYVCTRHDSSFCEKLDTESVTKCVIIVGVQFDIMLSMFEIVDK
jgi:hypothetical protein